MEYNFTTEYNAKNMAVMAKGLRKTVRRKHSRISHIAGWAMVALLGLLLMPAAKPGHVWAARDFINIALMAVLVCTLLFEDKINGRLAYKRNLEGMAVATCTFKEDGYISATRAGTTTFPYSNIRAIAENKDFFVFLLDKNHAQLYDKSGLTGGSRQEFARFICDKTGIEIVKF